MKYLKWLYKFSRFFLCYFSYLVVVLFEWIMDKLNDKSVTWKSLKDEFKGFWDGDNNNR